jgi:hypothetical protein
MSLLVEFIYLVMLFLMKWCFHLLVFTPTLVLAFVKKFFFYLNHSKTHRCYLKRGNNVA